MAPGWKRERMRNVTGWLSELFFLEDDREWNTYMRKRSSSGFVVSYERVLVADFTLKLNEILSI